MKYNGMSIIPCDECYHFGRNCKHYQDCDNDVKMGNGLRHFKENNGNKYRCTENRINNRPSY